MSVDSIVIIIIKNSFLQFYREINGFVVLTNSTCSMGVDIMYMINTPCYNGYNYSTEGFKSSPIKMVIAYIQLPYPNNALW